MQKLKNTSICVILFIVLLSSFGCGKNTKQSLDYETNVIQVTSKPEECQKVERKIPELELEDRRIYKDPNMNQKVLISNQKKSTRNLIYLKKKLDEAFSALDCYERQTKQ